MRATRFLLPLILSVLVAVLGGLGLRTLTPLLDSVTNLMPLRDKRSLVVEVVGLLHEAEKSAVLEKIREMSSADISAVKQRLESLDWIRDVRIRRSWPNVLQVEVIGKPTVARWGDSRYLDEDGNIFDAPSKEQDLPVLHGPAGSEKVIMSQYLKLNQVTVRAGKRIDKLTLDERGAWTFEMHGITVRLGQEDVMQRMSRFVRVYPSLQDASDIVSIDTRYPNGVAVFRDPSACKGLCYADLK